MNDFLDPDDHFQSMSSAVHTAAICSSGDVMTWSIETEGKPAGVGCPECGSEILYACPAPNCGKALPGEFNRNVVKGGGGTPPSYCIYCREPYPWTARRFETMRRALRLEPHFADLSPKNQKDVVEIADEIASGTLTDAETSARFRQLHRFPQIAEACYHEAKSFLSDTLGVAIGTMFKP